MLFIIFLFRSQFFVFRVLFLTEQTPHSTNSIIYDALHMSRYFVIPPKPLIDKTVHELMMFDTQDDVKLVLWNGTAKFTEFMAGNVKFLEFHCRPFQICGKESITFLATAFSCYPIDGTMFF